MKVRVDLLLPDCAQMIFHRLSPTSSLPWRLRSGSGKPIRTGYNIDPLFQSFILAGNSNRTHVSMAVMAGAG